MSDRAIQQAALAGLGRQALSGLDLGALLEEAASVVARELNVDQVAILELTGDGQGLLALEGTGLPEGVLGGVLPVESGEWNVASGLAADLGAACSLAVAIETPERRFGWLEAYAREPREFTAEEDAFFRGVADILGAAAERARYEDLVVDSERQFRELADTTPALMWMTDAEGDMTFVNEGWRRFTGGTETAGVTFASSAHPDDHDET